MQQIWYETFGRYKFTNFSETNSNFLKLNLHLKNKS